MPINNMSVGKDYTFVLVDGNTQTPISLGDVQTVKVNALKHDIVSRPYNGDPKFGFIPDGYGFAFTIVRTDPGLENYQLQNNVNFDDGVVQVAGYLNETIKEADGTTSRYQYPGFVVWIGDLGDVTRESNIKMTAEGRASTKVRLS